MIVRGPGARPIQGRSTRGSTAAAPDLPRAIYTHAASRDARPPEKLRAARLGLRAPIAAEELGFAATTTRPGPHPLHAHDQGLVIDCDLPEPSPSPLFDRRECRAPVNCGSAIDAGDWTGPERGASPETPCRVAYTKHDLRRRGPCGGQRVGLQLVESSTAGPKRLPLPCRSPPVVRARRHPRCRNSRKECRSRACPCKSGTGLEEYPPRARFLRLRRSLGR